MIGKKERQLKATVQSKSINQKIESGIVHIINFSAVRHIQYPHLDSIINHF